MIRQLLFVCGTFLIFLNAASVQAQTIVQSSVTQAPLQIQPAGQGAAAIPQTATAQPVAKQAVSAATSQPSALPAAPVPVSPQPVAAVQAPPPAKDPDVNLQPAVPVAPVLTASSAAGPLALSSPDDTAAADIIAANTYVEANYQNLSKLYWTLAVFDLTDNQAIDGFLMINECQLYLKYYDSDFELEGLRAATRASIEKNMPHFSRKFEIMIPIGLERYNMGTEKFSLSEKTQYLHSKRLEIKTDDNVNSNQKLCGMESDAPKYPRNFILSLTQPFNLTEIYVTPDVAQFYIEQTDKQSKTDYNLQLSSFGRAAYLFIKITLSQFRGITKGYMGSTWMADMFGSIDSYEIYADQKKTLLLYNAEIARKNEGQKRVSHAVVLPPDGPLIQAKDPGHEQKTTSDPDVDIEDTRNLLIPGVPKAQTPVPTRN